MSKFASGGESDRRALARIATQRPGKVLSGVFAWDCVIRDVTKTGAKAQMLAGGMPPAQAQLVDLVAGQAHDVQIVWQKEREVGFRITATYDLRGLTPAAARTAKKIWAASQGRVFAS